MREWVPFDGDPETTGYDHVSAQLPTEVLGPWSEKYRKLETLCYEDNNEGRYTLFWPDEDWCPRVQVPLKDQEVWDAEHAVRLALLRLRDLYLECGWDIKSKTQDSFDKKRFVEMRRRYLDEVVNPLERVGEEASRRSREQDLDQQHSREDL